MTKEAQKPVMIRPRILPRDFVDFCLSLAVGLFQTTLLFGIPALLAFLASLSFGLGVLISLCIGFVASFLAYCFFLLFVVRRLTVTVDGLRFHRVLGSPKFLTWDTISSVTVTPRSELILRGWLWPLFPSREMTPSLSSLQHYRISWDADFCYYPPAQSEVFEQHVVAKIQK